MPRNLPNLVFCQFSKQKPKTSTFKATFQAVTWEAPKHTRCVFYRLLLAPLPKKVIKSLSLSLKVGTRLTLQIASVMLSALCRSIDLLLECPSIFMSSVTDFFMP